MQLTSCNLECIQMRTHYAMIYWTDPVRMPIKALLYSIHSSACFCWRNVCLVCECGVFYVLWKMQDATITHHLCRGGATVYTLFLSNFIEYFWVLIGKLSWLLTLASNTPNSRVRVPFRRVIFLYVPILKYWNATANGKRIARMKKVFQDYSTIEFVKSHTCLCSNATCRQRNASIQAGYCTGF